MENNLKNKSKEELIGIIERKDKVELTLRSDIENMKNNANKFTYDYDGLRSKVCILESTKAELENTIDDLMNEVKEYRTFSVVFGIASVVELFLLIM